MQQQIRIVEFLESGTKRAHQLLRQISDKAHSIGDNRFFLGRKTQPPARGIESGEEPVLYKDLTVGQGVQERRLPRIGVANDRNYRHLSTQPPCTLLFTIFPQHFDLPFQITDTLTHPPPINFKLRLPGASSPNAPSQTGEGIAATGETWKAIAELRKFHLDFSGAALGTPAENIQDQLRAVDDLQLRQIGNCRRLGRREVLIKDEVVHAVLQRFNDDLLQLAAPQQIFGMDGLRALDHGLQ